MALLVFWVRIKVCYYDKSIKHLQSPSKNINKKNKCFIFVLYSRIRAAQWIFITGTIQTISYIFFLVGEALEVYIQCSFSMIDPFLLDIWNLTNTWTLRIRLLMYDKVWSYSSVSFWILIINDEFNLQQKSCFLIFHTFFLLFFFPNICRMGRYYRIIPNHIREGSVFFLPNKNITIYAYVHSWRKNIIMIYFYRIASYWIPQKMINGHIRFLI